MSNKGWNKLNNIYDDALIMVLCELLTSTTYYLKRNPNPQHYHTDIRKNRKVNVKEEV